jgi:hypothetical protein
MLQYDCYPLTTLIVKFNIHVLLNILSNVFAALDSLNWKHDTLASSFSLNTLQPEKSDSIYLLI